MLTFGGMFRRLFAKHDELEKSKANKDSTDARFEEMMADFKAHVNEDRDMHKDVLAEIRETNRHLSITNATLANLVGRFEATNGQR